MEAEMVDRAASVTAQYARRMRIVHHHNGAVLLGRLHQARQRTDVPIHREHAIGNHQLVARRAIQFRQNPLRGGGVFMWKYVNLGAGQTCAVNDAGVIQRIRNDMVFGREDRGHGTRVCGEAGLKHHAGFHILEARNALFQFHMQRHGSGDGSHGARTCAIFLRRGDGGFNQLGMRAKAQVVI